MSTITPTQRAKKWREDQKALLGADVFKANQASLKKAQRLRKKLSALEKDVLKKDILNLDLKAKIGKSVGFIAQEVAEVLPMAVSIQKDIIPNEMRNLENISWEEIIDGSNNTYKLRTDLQDISNVKYRFYVSNDASGNDEIQKEIIGNPDNTFTFDTSYNNIFCYGKEVDDFHTLDKNKLFALNFSATQELDKQLTAEKIKTATLETSVSTLKTKVASLEAAITEIQNKLG